MFTGIITGFSQVAVGRHLGSSRDHGKSLVKECPPIYIANVNLCAGITLNGACLTFTAPDETRNSPTIDISAEWFARMIELDQERTINHRKALAAKDGPARHLVSRHEDDIGTVPHSTQVGKDWDLRGLRSISRGKHLAIKCSPMAKEQIRMGNRLSDLVGRSQINANLIPPAVEANARSSLTVGSKVNLGTDLIAIYAGRRLSSGSHDIG